MQIYKNQNPFNTYREATKDERDYLVVKGVSLVEGVLNKYLVQMEDFGAFVKDWDGVPLVLRHPKGNNGSARVPSPDVPVVGNFYGASLDLDNRRLVGEYWFDKTSLLSSPDGERIHNDILAGKMIETSTGYYADIESVTGFLNGIPYVGIQRQIHPDHIAVLPDEIGACSIRDGCGINRNSAMINNCDSCVLKNMTGNLPPEAKAMYEEVYKKATEEGDDPAVAAKKAWGACENAGWKKEGDVWVKANAEETQAPSQDNWLVKLFTNSIKEKKQMDEMKALFTQILNKLEGKTASQNAEGDPPPATPDTLTGLASMIDGMGGIQAFADFLNVLKELPAKVQELQDMLKSTADTVATANAVAQNAAAVAEAKKKKMVARLIANAYCPFDETTLNGMTEDVLGKLEISYRPTNYAALGGFVQNQGMNQESDVLSMPSFLNSYQEKEPVK